jgi:GDP-4-dehydro-6-deoxy-D-mannose reductase
VRVAGLRAFVTGAEGFVGRWLCRHLLEAGDEVVRAGVGVDVTDPDQLHRALADAEPDAVYHLAAASHVGESWKEPRETFRVNALGTLEVLAAVRALRRPARTLVVSSSEVYGPVPAELQPVDESRPMRPLTPYAASKAAAELLGVQAALGFGQEVVIARPFNHVGPGQRDDFVVAALARRVATAERVGAEAVTVGNLDAVRDFTDVRDIVRAYRLLIGRGQSGVVYNVCSGVGRRISEVADALVRSTPRALRLLRDPALERSKEVSVLIGSSERLRAETGWAPAIPFEVTLADTLAYWREVVGASPEGGDP